MMFSLTDEYYNISNNFQVSHILQLILQQIIGKYHKRVKHLLYPAKLTCDKQLLLTQKTEMEKTQALYLLPIL